MRLIPIALCFVVASNAFAAKISGSSNNAASQTSAGIVTTGTQDFAGAKTFYSNLTCSGCSLLAGVSVVSDLFKSNSATTLTIQSDVPASGSTDTAFTLLATNALSQSAGVDSLLTMKNGSSGGTVYNFWSSVRLLMQSEAANQAPGFHIKAASSGEMLFRLAGGSGEIAQAFSNNTTISDWQWGGCPATNCTFKLGPGSATSEAASELVIYKGTNGPAIKANVPVRHVAYSLPTCASGTERTIASDTLSGGTTGNRTRMCLCTSDGGGTPAYAWQNMVSGTVGTTTTCPN